MINRPHHQNLANPIHQPIPHHPVPISHIPVPRLHPLHPLGISQGPPITQTKCSACRCSHQPCADYTLCVAHGVDGSDGWGVAVLLGGFGWVFVADEEDAQRDY
jgi:hypothetical protein